MTDVIAIVPSTLGSYFIRDGELVNLPVRELESGGRLPACGLALGAEPTSSC